MCYCYCKCFPSRVLTCWVLGMQAEGLQNGRSAQQQGGLQGLLGTWTRRQVHYKQRLPPPSLPAHIPGTPQARQLSVRPRQAQVPRLRRRQPRPEHHSAPAAAGGWRSSSSGGRHTDQHGSSERCPWQCCRRCCYGGGWAGNQGRSCCKGGAGGAGGSGGLGGGCRGRSRRWGICGAERALGGQRGNAGRG